MGVNGSGGFKILKRGVPVCELCVRRASGKGGSGGMPPPRKIFDFWPSEIISGVFL